MVIDAGKLRHAQPWNMLSSLICALLGHQHQGMRGKSKVAVF